MPMSPPSFAASSAAAERTTALATIALASWEPVPLELLLESSADIALVGGGALQLNRSGRATVTARLEVTGAALVTGVAIRLIRAGIVLAQGSIGPVTAGSTAGVTCTAVRAVSPADAIALEWRAVGALVTLAVGAGVTGVDVCIV